MALWRIDGSAVWSAIFAAAVAFGAQLIAHIWIPHWQQGFNAVTTLMLLTSAVIGVLVALIEHGREKQRRR